MDRSLLGKLFVGNNIYTLLYMVKCCYIDIYIVYKIEREIIYNNFLFFKLRKEYCKSFFFWFIIVVCKIGFIFWNVIEKYIFIDGWVSKRKELLIIDGLKE